MHNRIRESYFEWLLKMIKPTTNYRSLLEMLFNIDFVSMVPMDNNRISDGNLLRHEYIREKNYQSYYIEYLGEHGCSVLEMMIALSRRIEVDIMSDPDYGNRTSKWFWGMIETLGLSEQIDDNFDEGYVSFVLLRFMNRKYEPDGHGGLFLSVGSRDNRTIEIWYQAQAYLVQTLKERGIL